MNSNLKRSTLFTRCVRSALILSLTLLVACGPFSPLFSPLVEWDAEDAPQVQAPPQPANPQDQQPAQPSDQQVQPSSQRDPGAETTGDTGSPINEVNAADVVGDWQGPPCDEAEGTYIYRWSVDLMTDPQTGQVVGTVKFHNCPGGGRVLYRVTGETQMGDIVLLSGTKMDGGGSLYTFSAGTTIFTFNTATGSITPQLVSSAAYPGLPLKPVGFMNSGTIPFTVQAETYIPLGQTTPTTPSDASTVAMVSERNSSSYLDLPMGTYTWCYWWEVGDINDDGYIEYRHAYQTQPLTLDENTSAEPETAPVVTLGAPPSSGDTPGTCNQP